MATSIYNDTQLIYDCITSNDVDFKQYISKAEKITFENFGVKRKLFNPIYISDICLADCPYCGFRVSNKSIARKTLKPSETIAELDVLIERGVKNILLLAGDYKHSKYVEMLKTNIQTIKQSRNIDWLGIEVATLNIEEYKTLFEAGAESVTVFQETYNRAIYDKLHQNPEYKGDFDFRYNAQERAIIAGFKEVGFGILYGIGNWIEDTLAMAEHSIKLNEKYPKVKFRFSFPRLKLSKGLDESCVTENVSTAQIYKAIVAFRILFPDSKIVLTGRESIEFLSDCASIVDTIGYAGSTAVGGYSKIDKGLNQFELSKDSNFIGFKQKLVTYEFD